MKAYLFSCLMFLASITRAQQAPIAVVSSSGTTKLTTSLDSAALIANQNDIIYLPGGIIRSTGNTPFTKKVTIIGVGHNPDSSSATGRTVVDAIIAFGNGADGSILDGVYVTQRVYVGADIKIFRCNIGDIVADQVYPIAKNLIVDKCVIRLGVNGYSNTVVNPKISNSVLSGNDYSSNVSGGTFENNVFLIQNGLQFVNVTNSTFRNNVFAAITDWGTTPLPHFFFNNVFATSALPPLLNAGNAIGNILGQSPSSTFVNAPGVDYSYANDYVINPSSPAKNAGSDGKDIGIYGGVSPWKKGNIPPNPNIRFKSVDASTNASGTLRVRFKVAAQ